MTGATETFFLFAAAVLAADLASVGDGDLRFGVDTALFDYIGSDTLGLEIYQQVNLGEVSMDSDSMASFLTTVALVDAGGDTVAFDEWISRVRWVPDRSVVNSVVFPTPPGTYTLEVAVTDQENGKTGKLSRIVEVEPQGALSQLELARALVPAPDESTNPLRKGKYMVYPAADGGFTLPREHKAYYYVELYGMAGESVRVQGRLETGDGEVIFARPPVTVTVPEEGDVVGLVDSLDLMAARTSGIHRLVFTLVTGDDTLETEKYLVIGREENAQAATPVVSGDAEEAVPYLEQFALLLNSGERDLFENLDQDARARFYLAYWGGDPRGRRDFETRCGEAERYAIPGMAGWKTDRGRVYVIYGRPDDIDAVLFQGEHVPYEIWYYHEHGNEKFVFADLDGTGNYRQVFSTVEGEISYTNWERMLAPISGGGGG